MDLQCTCTTCCNVTCNNDRLLAILQLPIFSIDFSTNITALYTVPVPGVLIQGPEYSPREEGHVEDDVGEIEQEAQQVQADGNIGVD